MPRTGTAVGVVPGANEQYAPSVRLPHCGAITNTYGQVTILQARNKSSARSVELAGTTYFNRLSMNAHLPPDESLGVDEVGLDVDERAAFFGVLDARVERERVPARGRPAPGEEHGVGNGAAGAGLILPNAGR